MTKARKSTIAEMVASIPDNDPMRNPPASFITMRDLFAAHAVAGLTGNYANEWTDREYAENAYAIADAMLAERLKVEP